MINAARLSVNTEVIGAGVALGVLYQIQGAITSSMRAASGAYAEYERLNLSFQSLLAREKLMRDSRLAMTTALAQSSQEAERLVAWNQRLAISSPFDEAGVSSAFKTAQGFGFVADSMDKTEISAKRLTTALINQSAATGGSTETMFRVAYALGQMRTAGKVMGGEVMQLTQAGVNVNDYLARGFGKTTSEIIAMREKGLVPANKAIKAIVEGLERDYGAAATMQANTMMGLQNSLQDLQTITSRTLFGSFFDPQEVDAAGKKVSTLKDFLGELVGMAQGPEFLNWLDQTSETLADIGVAASDGLRGAIPVLGSVFELLKGIASTGAGALGFVAEMGQTVARMIDSTANLRDAGNLDPGMLGRVGSTVFLAGLGGQLLLRGAQNQIASRVAAKDAAYAAWTTQRDNAALLSSAAQGATQRVEASRTLAALRGDTASYTTALRDTAAAQALNTRATAANNEVNRQAARIRDGNYQGVRKFNWELVKNTGFLAVSSLAIASVSIAWQEYQKQVDAAVRAASDASPMLKEFNAILKKQGMAGMDDQQRLVYTAEIDFDEAQAEYRKAHANTAQVMKDEAFNLSGGWAGVMADMLSPLQVGLTHVFVSAVNVLIEGMNKIPNVHIEPLTFDVDDAQRQRATLERDLQMVFGDSKAQAQARITEAQKAEAASLDNVRKAATHLDAIKNMIVVKAPSLELTADQQTAFDNLLKVEDEYQQERLDRDIAYERKLREIGKERDQKLLDARKSYGKQLREIDKNYWESLRKNAEAAAKELPSALAPVITADVGFLRGIEDRREAHNEKLAVLAKQGAQCKLPEEEKAFAEQERLAAAAYVEQQRQQQEHLGRMLVDYITAQALRNNISQSALDQMTAAIRDEYGIQETLAEQSFRMMRGEMDAWVESGGRGTEDVIENLAIIREATVETQMAYEDMVKEQTDALADQFAAGRINRDEYLRLLRDVPRQARSELGINQEGPAESERQKQLVRDTNEAKLNAEKSYLEQVKQIREEWYGEAMASAAKNHAAEEAAARESYALRLKDAEAGLKGITEAQREEMYRQVMLIVEQRLILNTKAKHEFDKIRQEYEGRHLTPEEEAALMRRLRDISRRYGTDQAGLQDTYKPPPPPDWREVEDQRERAGLPRAFGGEVWPSRAYWVGEREPELFVPREAGYILPPSRSFQLPAGALTMRNLTLNLHIGSVDSDARVRQMAEYVLRVLNTQIDDVILTGGKR